MTEKKPFLTTTILALLGRSGGVLVPVFVAFFMGAESGTDAFFFAYAIIFALQSIFAHIFEAALVPYVVERKENSGNSTAFTLKVLKFVFPLMALISMGVGFLLLFLLNLKSSIPPQTAKLIPGLYWEMLPGLLTAVLVSAYQGFFYAHKKFWFPSISPIFRTVTMIIFFLLGKDSIGIHALTLGFTVGEVLRWGAAHWLLTRSNDLRKPDASDDYHQVKDFLKQAGYQFLVMIAFNVMPLADQWAAVPLGSGKLSLFNYADRLVQVPYLLFSYGFTRVFLSFWSENHLKENFQTFFKKVERDMRVVFLGAAVLVLPLYFFSVSLIHLIFIRSNLTLEQLGHVAEIFRWLVIGFLPGILRVLYGRVLMIIRKSKFYFFQSSAELIMKIALNLLFTSWFGIAGLAMATALIYTVTALWLYLYLKRQARLYPVSSQ